MKDTEMIDILYDWYKSQVSESVKHIIEKNGKQVDGLYTLMNSEDKNNDIGDE